MPIVDRTEQVQGWMDAFKVLHPEVKYVDDINTIPTAKYLNHCYWERLNDGVKPYMSKEHPDSRVNRHKIASLYESIIAFNVPILSADGTSDGPVNPLNYVFAYFVAQVILDTFNQQKGVEVEYFIGDEFDREHLALLSLSPIGDGFVFANAATWSVVEMYCVEKAVQK